MIGAGNKFGLWAGFVILFSFFLIIVPEFHHSALFFELLIQFRPHIIGVFIVFSLILLLKRRYILFFVQIIPIIIGFCLIFASYSGFSTKKSCAIGKNAQDIRILSLNVYYKNEKYEEIVRAIEVSEADIVFLQEVQSGLYHYGHERLLQKYPFYYSALEKGIEHGKTLYSKYPIIEAQVQNLEAGVYKALQVELEIDSTPVHFVGIHSISPKSAERMNSRNRHIEALTRYIEDLNTANEGARIIVAGDFNTTPWHPVMRKFEKQTKLGNNGFYNIVGTWSTRFPSFLTIPIDHIFYSSNFGRSKYYRGILSGSDHYPIYADLQMCK